jgi:hypothetical protein
MLIRSRWFLVIHWYIYIYGAKHLFANHVPWESMGKPQSMCSLLEGSNCENLGIRKKSHWSGVLIQHTQYFLNKHLLTFVCFTWSPLWSNIVNSVTLGFLEAPKQIKWIPVHLQAPFSRRYRSIHIYHIYNII